jgi:CDP-2,3-bis-(O-geranylgeranyl)-sn-glycerol synthase
MSFNDALYALWFFVPAGFANATPIVVAKWPVFKDWTAPIDCGLTFRGKRLLGDNKTWRGLITATIVGTILFGLQQWLAPQLGGFSAYLTANGYTQLPHALGALLGAGALIGDGVESFFKRQHGIDSGTSWFPFDQLDYIIGACVFAAPVVLLPLRLYVWIFLEWLLLHLVFTYIGYKLHFRQRAI